MTLAGAICLTIGIGAMVIESAGLGGGHGWIATTIGIVAAVAGLAVCTPASRPSSPEATWVGVSPYRARSTGPCPVSVDANPHLPTPPERIKVVAWRDTPALPAVRS